jgi:hypothetical protein
MTVNHGDLPRDDRGRAVGGTWLVELTMTRASHFAGAAFCDGRSLTPVKGARLRSLCAAMPRNVVGAVRCEDGHAVGAPLPWALERLGLLEPDEGDGQGEINGSEDGPDAPEAPTDDQGGEPPADAPPEPETPPAGTELELLEGEPAEPAAEPAVAEENPLSAMGRDELREYARSKGYEQMIDLRQSADGIRAAIIEVEAALRS